MNGAASASREGPDRGKPHKRELTQTVAGCCPATARVETGLTRLLHIFSGTARSFSPTGSVKDPRPTHPHPRSLQTRPSPQRCNFPFSGTDILLQVLHITIPLCTD